ncbi:MAG: PD-(D/E)XK nuclease family protein [Candidatus Omnitrophica bacterium]|nr:PD-(D/E)XK nuclease family protein [Candidatus Omnitrophota bacterium]
MSKIITIPFTDDFIERLADYIHEEYILKGKDLRQVAIVFGGHRPYLFLKRALARRCKAVFYPPKFFSIDEWMKHIVQTQKSFQPLSSLDHCYLIYELASKHTPELLEGRMSFASFLPWAQEILSLIDQMDLESVTEDALKNLKAQAQIGFDVPEGIGHLLESLFILRQTYHQELERRQIMARGYQYDLASRLVASMDLSVWQEILFCNFFYLHRSEMKVVEHCYKQGNTTLLIQGDQRRWPALKRISSVLGQDILEGREVIEGDFDLKLHAAFDAHSQAAIVKGILNQISNPENTVIVLPQSDFILPLLSAISGEVKEFNISMGYPLKRSALYDLLDRVLTAQKSRQEKLFYTRDYLRVLHHPLVKSLDASKVQVIRALTHQIEEILTGQVLSELSGQLFLDLDALAKDEKIFEETMKSLTAINVPVTLAELRSMLEFLHDILFKRWQKAQTFKDLAVVLGEFTSVIRQTSAIAQYPFNDRIALYLENLSQELQCAQFASGTFVPSEMFRILEDILSNQMVAFTGSPLRGLQILGLFETRALSFENVIVVDVNEGILPNLNIYEPFIPRDIMIKLNLDRLELEEEIQRYGFMRLISSAKKVHLVYQERSDRERSRLIEELIWQEEKKGKQLDIVPIERGRFPIAVTSKPRMIVKTPSMIEFLKGMTFSASSLNTYLRNPYEFYENYVLGLREQDNLLDDPQAKHIGTFVHHFLEDVFKGFINKKPVLDAEFKKYFFKVMENRFQESFGQKQRSDAFLMKTVLETRFERFFDVERERCRLDVDVILLLEKKFNEEIDLNGKRIKMTYRMDRIDRLVDGSILVVDYKTGGAELIPKSFDELLESSLTRQQVRDQLLSFQMPMYLEYLSKQYPNTSVNAALYHLRTNTLEKFVKGKDQEFCQNAIAAGLKALDFITDEIFNPQIPFVDDNAVSSPPVGGVRGGGN